MQLQDRLFDMYQRVRPEAISLVDAFDFNDRMLDSILGRYDGQVYDNLYKWARDSPLNREEVGQCTENHLNFGQ
jgi:acyl-CoA oxidase